jgi:hypothetical protein
VIDGRAPYDGIDLASTCGGACFADLTSDDVVEAITIAHWLDR